MKHIEEFFKNGHRSKGAFLSRIFGIFNEEVVRIWARDENSPYELIEARPTLYRASGRYTLDFLFKKGDEFFVSEMKCEIQYQNYKYWRLTDITQLEHHRHKPAFELFLELARCPNVVKVKAKDEISVSGSVLVWGAASRQGIIDVKSHFGFTDILTVENCIEDLIEWKNNEYFSLINDREEWVVSFFELLRGKHS